MLQIKTSFIVLLIALAASFCNCASTGSFLQDLEPEIAADVLSIVINGTVHFAGTCAHDQGVKVNYWWYTKSNPDKPTKLSSFKKLNNGKPIKFLIHGWGGDRDVGYLTVIKEAYVGSQDVNVVIVDWGAYAKGKYTSAYCNVPVVGQALAKHLSNAQKEFGWALGDIHIVGHSLGAQVAGEAGKQLQGKLGRISALDAAGPLYQNIGIDQRLDATDAIFVDAIHTNQMQYGYLGNIGDIDFYPSCGYFQPGCLSSVLSVGDILKLPLDVITCNHQRSCDLFAESIVKNDFPAKPCVGCGLTPVCVPKLQLIDKEHVRMGEYCTSKQRNAEYVVYTNAQPLYGSNEGILTNLIPKDGLLNI